MIRVLVKSSQSGTREETYFCTNEDEFEQSAEEFFFMDEGDTIDIDKVIDCPELEDLPLAFDRSLVAKS